MTNGYVTPDVADSNGSTEDAGVVGALLHPESRITKTKRKLNTENIALINHLPPNQFNYPENTFYVYYPLYISGACGLYNAGAI